MVKLLDDIKNLKKSLNHISVYDLNTYTAIELYYALATKTNEVITELSRFEGVISDEIIEQNEKLTYLLGEGLNIEVVKKINQMVVDGTIDTIINHKLFNSLENKIEEKANSSTVTNIQNQINNLVLGAVGDGNNAEVIQARGHYKVLNDRLNNNDILIETLKDVVETEIIDYNLEWEKGGLNSQGEFIDNHLRIRTNKYLKLSGDVFIHGNTSKNIQIYWYKFDGNLNFIECSDGWKYGTELKNTAGYYYRFALKYTVDADISVKEGSNARVFQIKRNNNILINELNFEYKEFEKGGISYNGELTSNENMYRSSTFLENPKDTMFLVNPKKYSYSIHYYDLENGVYVHKGVVSHNDINGSSFYELPKTDYGYFKIVTRFTVDFDENSYYTGEHLIKLLTNLRLFTLPCFKNIEKNLEINICNNPIFSPYRFKLQGHRGLCDEYPENTILSFEEAGKSGVYAGIETDVQRTSDGVFVLMHDDTIDRTTNGMGVVSDYTYAELQELYIDGGYGWSDTYANQLKIPTLLDYLKVCRKYNLIPYIEIKLLDNQGLEDLISFLNQQGFKGRCIITSFNWSYLEYIANITNDYPLEYMPYAWDTDYKGMIDKLSKYNNTIIRLSASVITEDIVNKFREKDILVDAYGLPVGDTATLNRLKELGVEGVTCNSYKFSS